MQIKKVFSLFDTINQKHTEGILKGKCFTSPLCKFNPLWNYNKQRGMQVRSFIQLVLVLLTSSYAGSALSGTSFNYYKDSRDYDTLGIVISANKLPHGFSVWGFTDFHSNQHTDKQQADFTRSFSEYRLTNSLISRWTNIDGIGLQAEYNDSTPGIDNTVWRLGFTYKHRFSDQHWVQLRALPLQDNQDSQASLIFSVSLHPRISLTGFADYNIRSGNENRWVIEPQLNLLMLENTWLLFELRYNEFEEHSPTSDGTGVAAGLRYDI